MFHGKGTLYFENGGKFEATWVDGIATEVSFIICSSIKKFFLILAFKIIRENIRFQMVWSFQKKIGSIAMVMIDDSIQKYAMV